MGERLLDVKELKTYFDTEQGRVKAVDDVSFSIDCGETFGVVGESGCGKSVTALSIMQLVPGPKGKIVGGEINYHRLETGETIDILKLDNHGKKMRNMRGN